MNVGAIQSSVASLIVYLKEATEESDQASLHVEIKNLGEREIRGVTICVSTPDGIHLVNPGEISKKSSHSARVPAISVGQMIRFRVGVKKEHDFREGKMLFRIHGRQDDSLLEPPQIEASLHLQTHTA